MPYGRAFATWKFAIEIHYFLLNWGLMVCSWSSFRCSWRIHWIFISSSFLALVPLVLNLISGFFFCWFWIIRETLEKSGTCMKIDRCMSELACLYILHKSSEERKLIFFLWQFIIIAIMSLWCLCLFWNFWCSVMEICIWVGPSNIYLWMNSLMETEQSLLEEACYYQKISVNLIPT